MEEQIIKTEYSEVMQKAFIDYAMSVIVARALPDVRDGLKPVQRRVLYDMNELGIRHDKPYRKSARIVGDTMGKYHPHGDSSIYDSLVVMSQEFKKGLPLVDGHGNFGNIEGDGAAAMRYTEARLEKITEDAFLADLDKDTVDFLPNYDETEKEPAVLPVRIPNLLINGSEGIAVGMATSIPPHNLGEVIDGMKALMNDPEMSVKQLLRYIKGPDFPTGGVVINKDELAEIYETGTGKIKLRGKVEIEKGKNGHVNVVITEIPYPMIGANIAKFLIDVAKLSETKKTADIVDITNQSSKEGIRIVIELKKDADADQFVNMLYKKTRLEDTFGVNMLAISHGRPETMSLKQVLSECIDFQFEIATRKYTTLLKKEQDKREIQEGLIKACNVIDLIIEILRGSKDRAMAKACLVEGKTDGIRFKTTASAGMAMQLRFTDRQADAILDMRLYKLIGLEMEALIKEHEDTLTNIYRYEDILERRDSMSQVIISDLDKIKKEYAKPRRTVVENGAEAIYEEKKIEEMDIVFMMDRFGYCRCVDLPTFERNREAAEQESRYIVPCKNTGKVCLFTEEGALHTFRASDVPFGKFRDKAVPVDNISTFHTDKETVVYAASQSELNLYRLIFVTAQGMVKVVSGGEFDVSKRFVAATKLSPGDKLVSVQALTDQQEIVLRTASGYFLRFAVSEISEMKKTAVGMKGINLTSNDHVEAVYYTGLEHRVTVNVDGKDYPLNDLRIAGRATRGSKLK